MNLLNNRGKIDFALSPSLNVDPTNVNTSWDRATLAKEMGQINTIRPVLLTEFGPKM